MTGLSANLQEIVRLGEVIENLKGEHETSLSQRETKHASAIDEAKVRSTIPALRD